MNGANSEHAKDHHDNQETHTHHDDDCGCSWHHCKKKKKDDNWDDIEKNKDKSDRRVRPP